MKMVERFDFVIYGATGFTGYYCVRNLVKINNEKNQNYNFAIAGRNAAKLRDVLAKVGEELKQDLSNVTVIEANADDKQSLINMTKQAKVMVTVVGPYFLYGRPLVEACLETLTHYVDISGEPQFTEAIQTEFYEEAKQKGLYIISSCGFDCIPADIGSMFLKDQTPDMEIKQIDAYLNVHNPKGFTVNKGTLYSLLESLKNMKKLREIRGKMFEKIFPKKIETSKSSLKWFHSAPYARKGYYIPFWPLDQSVVKRTQMQIYQDDSTYKPFSFKEYINVPNVFHAIGMVLIFGSILFFSLFDFTRNLVKKYPQIFTLGFFGNDGPTKEQVTASKFEMYLVARGHKKNEPSVKQTRTLYLRGPEIAYDATSLFLLNAGRVVLEELADQNKENSGVVTPGYAFRNTKYVEKIRELISDWKFVENR